MKGISTIIATVLLVIIVVAIVGLTYTFSVTLFQQTTGGATNQTQQIVTSLGQQIRIESVAGNIVSVRSVGYQPVNLSNLGVFLNDAKANFIPKPTVLSPNTIGSIAITDFVKAGDKVKLVSGAGTVEGTITDPCKTAVLCLKFDEGSGNIVRDSSGSSGNDGIINASGKNQIANSSFEDTIWGTSEVRTSEEKWHKDFSAKLVASGSPIASGSSNSIPASYLVGKTFTVSAYVKIPIMIKGNAYLRIFYHNSTDHYITHKDWTVITSTVNSWTRYSLEIPTSSGFHPSNIANTDHIHVDFAWWNPTSDPSGTLYIDAYQLEMGLLSSYSDSAWDDGKSGKALQFDGFNDYVNISDKPELNPTNAISISAWVYRKSAPLNIWSRIVSKEGATSSYTLWIDSANSINFNIWSSGVNKNVWSYHTGGQLLQLNKWSYIVAIYNGSHLTLSLDGRSWSNPATGNIDFSSSPVQIGGTSYYFDGMIDEVRIYSRAIY